MTVRTTSKTVTFRHPFNLSGTDAAEPWKCSIPMKGWGIYELYRRQAEQQVGEREARGETT